MSGSYWYGAVPCRIGKEEWMPERRWYAFLITSVVAPFALTIPVILGRLLLNGVCASSTTRDGKQSITSKRGRSWSHQLADKASYMVSDQTVTGIFLKLTAVLCAVGSLIIYWRDSAPLCLDVELCHEWTTDVWWPVDLAFNCYFLFYFFLRFAAHDNKIAFIWSFMSMVDYFTIPPTFVAIGLDRNWFGLRYLRVLNLLWLVDVFRSTGLLTTVLAIKFARLVVYIIVAVIVGAGTFLLLECSGDPWDMDNTLQQNTTFWNFAYFSVVTISTVGYGDLGTKTILGRIFCSMYIFACLFFIASFIAIAASLLPPPRRYPKFDRQSNFNHIVLCGDISTSTIQSFVKTFLHAMQSKGLQDILIILLHPTPPDDDMILLLNQYPSFLEYKLGSPLNEADLEEASISVAGSCIILAKQNSTNHAAEDAKSVLQFIAIKNYSPRTPVQVQVLNNATRTFLNTYPDLKEERGDLVLCQKDLESALLGINCLIPAFSTIMTNLLSPPPLFFKVDPGVPELYKSGSQMRLCSVRFSPSFYGMTFLQAARLCFEKLNVVLIAVYSKEGDDDSMEYHDVLPNPGHNIAITQGMMAHLIAHSTSQANAVGIYCRQCHADTDNTSGIIAVCHCPGNQRYAGAALGSGKKHYAIKEDGIDHQTNGHTKVAFNNTAAFFGEINNDDYDRNMQVDSTGMFYVCPPRDLQSCTIDMDEAEQRVMENHVVVLVIENDVGVNGDEEMANELDKIVNPLRGVSNVGHPSRLAPILIVARKERVEAIWPKLAMLPQITVLAADARVRAVVRAAQVQHCRACLIVSTGGGDESLLGLGQRIDQNVVMMVLQLRSMTFLRPSVSSSADTPVQETWYSLGRDIPCVALFENEQSLRFISAGAGQNDDYYYSRPFMAGRVLISDHLRSNMMVPACFDPSMIRLLTCLSFGESSLSAVERVMAEGRGLLLSSSSTPLAQLAHQEHYYTQALRLMNLSQGPLQYSKGCCYGRLFLTLLQEHGIIALGLYRLFAAAETGGTSVEQEGPGSSNLRFVACNPPADTVLLSTDQVYLLFPATFS